MKHINHHKKIGVGLEAEGFFLTKEGYATALIHTPEKTLPTSEFVLQEIHKNYPQLIASVSPELVSVTIEVKSKVYQNFTDPINEIQHIRNIINTILFPYNTALYFEPVISKPYDIIPSVLLERSSLAEKTLSHTARSRIHRVLKRFQYTEDKSSLYESTICSLQINDSRLLATSSHETLFEDVRLLYNGFITQIHTLLQHNSTKKDFRGKTRMENYVHFLSALKKEQFKRHGISPEYIIFPKEFTNEQELRSYLAAHVDAPEFTHNTSSKNINSFIKYKTTINATEVRVIDAQDSLHSMQAACATYEHVYQHVATHMKEQTQKNSR